MRGLPQRLPIVLVLLAAGAGHTQAEDEPLLRVTRLTEKVMVLTEQSPWESNHVVIVSKRGLVLVDPGGSPVMARRIREAVRAELGRDDFAYIVNHHHHWGHTWGSSAFPEAVVVGHEAAVDLMQRDASTLAAKVALFRDRARELDAQIAELDPAGEEAREARMQRDHAARISEGLSEDGFSVRAPELAFNDRLTLDLGDVTLRLFSLGRGHSETDTVILIPEERVLLMGCFFFLQRSVPFFGLSPELDVDRWIETLEAVLDGENRVDHVVLGQRAIWDGDTLRRWRDYIADLWRDVRRVESEGEGLEDALALLEVPAGLRELEKLGVDEDAINAFHRRNITIFWRQLKDSAALIVGRAIAERGLAAGLEAYSDLRKKADRETFFDEGEFNALGYQLLGQGRISEAIAIFELNVEAYPQSWNVHDSLGEAYMANGDDELAIASYRRSIELNPDNSNGLERLKRLEAAAAATE